ncbi:MAG: pilus assembly protein PilF [Betaproteobacteria bacterium]|nr:pilus assembly protein PilF [Betaproteobacteria bacterium]NBO44278.1 pilus assembly protein PilF [Betaproteobacteria bacterium]NBP10268.1 pilus assembly protein PilF [Betaproteobacteria bacterium]NBP60936.1 pilus assembly protein PilF [Betaproteobacteria bacterium]NBQ07885.1 pilus assembly protein PilF [Betaproteobacteria bacterium]
MRAQVFALNLLGLHQQTVDRLRQMQAQRPDDFFVLTTLAHFLGQADQTRAEAITLLERALVQGPESAALHFNLAYLLEQQRRMDEAEVSFRTAIAMDEKLDRAWYGLGLVLIQKGQADDALQALKRNTELQPMSPFGWYQLARLHVDRAEPDLAVAIIRHLQGFEPKVAEQLKRETGLKT